jgi:biotin carboxylase
VILGVREMAQGATAEIAAALGLPGNPPHAVSRVRTKDLCRAALAAAGFRQPEVRLCLEAADAGDFLRRTNGPWVVKPRDGMGSQGVSRVDGPADLDRALAGLPTSGPFLVEQFVEGPEYSVEGLFLDGVPTVLAVTEKEKSEPPYFVELGHVLPAPLPAETTERIGKEVAAALLALDLCYGLFHVELWQDSQGIVLGEVHVRNAGGWIHRMLAHVIPGLEMFGLVCDNAVGRPVALPAAPSRGAAARFLTAPPGRLAAVEGWDRVRSHPAVIYAELTVEPGEIIRPLHSGEERLGAIVVGADTAEAARALVHELAASVHFAVEQEQ